MSEFILVKNADGSGNMLLRVGDIMMVVDNANGNGKSIIKYGGGVEDHWSQISMSTAAEVLEAIQAAQGGCALDVRRVLARDMGHGQDTSRFTLYHNADTSQANGEIVTRNTILAGPIGERWQHISPLRASYIDGSQLLSSAFTEERIAETRAQVGSCICPHHQGDNPACPVHGEGTAWGDLHGE